MHQAITHAIDCHRVCHETYKHCLKTGGDYAEPEFLTLIRDCAELCLIAGHFMTRESELHKDVCDLCATACERIAKKCDKFGDDAQMKECADVARMCAASCRKMIEVEPKVK